MLVGFVFGFIAAYIASAAIAFVLSQSIRGASSLDKLPEASLVKSSEIELGMDKVLFDELRCV